MTQTSIFIRSFAKDFCWLEHCLRSIQRYATGFCEIIVAVPHQDMPLLSCLTAETVIGVHDVGRGYMVQMVNKLNADRHTKADYILYFDSDCIFTKPVTPDTFLHGGKPRWLVTDWADLQPKDKLAWFSVMAKALQQCPPYEFMRKHPFMVPRWALPAFRGFMHATHGITLEQYVMSQPGHEFSEWNCLGFYLWLHHRDRIEWHDTGQHGIPDYGEVQRWSYGGITPEVRRELESAMAW